MAKQNMKAVLASPDKGISKTYGANGVLSRLFRQMLHDLNITGPRFGNLLYDYITDSRHGVPNNKKDQTSIRGNLTKEFARPQMTWKVLCKALRFLQIVKIDLVIKAYHANGKTSLHSTVVQFGSRKELHLFNEGLEQSEDKESTIDVPYLVNQNENDNKTEEEKL